MRKLDCLKCEKLKKIDKTYPHGFIELKCGAHRENRLIECYTEDELVKRTHMEIAYAPPLWCPYNALHHIASMVSSS
jgi:hypothetical protein